MTSNRICRRLLLTICCFITARTARANVQPLFLFDFPGSDEVESVLEYVHGPGGALDLTDVILTLPMPDDKRTRVDSVVDVVVQPVTKACADAGRDCDWSAYGIGVWHADRVGTSDPLTLCCSAVMCPSKDPGYGRLMINETRFSGTRFSLPIPPKGNFTVPVTDTVLPLNETGYYAVLFANCHPQGRYVAVVGSTDWTSSTGHLPGVLYSFLLFYALLIPIYLGLLLWFFFGLAIHSSQAFLATESMTFGALFCGLCEAVLRTADYTIWNETNQRAASMVYGQITAQVLKEGLTLTLIVAIAMGRGVTCRVAGAGLLYIAGSTVREGLLARDETHEELVTEEGRYAFVQAANLFMVVLQVVFLVWIFCALHQTTEHLLTNTQDRNKIVRYLRLRNVLIVTVAAVFLFGIITLGAGSMTVEGELIMQDASTDVAYLVVVAAIAILWQPREGAKEYVMVFSDEDDNGNDGGGIFMDQEEDGMEVGPYPVKGGDPEGVFTIDDDDDDDDDEVHRNLAV